MKSSVKTLAPVVLVFITLGLLLGIASPSNANSAEFSPLIRDAWVQPTKVHPGDTMTVTAEVSDPSGIETVTADMGGIETIPLSLIEGSIYDGTWQGQWLVHDTTARDYVTTIVATNSLGKGSTYDIVWRDPQTYERYYIESESQQTTTSTNWVDALTLTFTPNVAGNFLILGYASLGNSSTAYYTEWQVVYGATVIDSGVILPLNVVERCTAGTHDVISLSTQSYSFKLQYRTSNALGTASIARCSLAAFAVSDYHHIDGTDGSTTEETYQDAATLTFTPAADDYLVLSTMDITNSSTTISTYAQLYSVFDAASWGEVVRAPPTTSQYEIYAIARKATLTAASRTFKIQYRTSGSSTAYIRNARITAVRLADLGDAEYAESEGVSTTNTIDYSAIKTSLTHNHNTYHNHLLLFFALVNGDVTNKNFYAASYIDGVVADERIMRPNVVTDFLSLYTLDYHLLSPTLHTNEIRYKAEVAARTTSIKNARILAIDADTLNPFSDSGHTTYCNNFNSPSLDRVYVQGCYFQVSHNFTVAYYDNGGSKVLSDGVLSGDNGTVNSLCIFSDYPASAAGTWHAVIYDNSVASPPATYTANDPNSIRECTFTVTQDAIPEFPSVFASVGVGGMCFGIYWWMKRRAKL